MKSIGIFSADEYAASLPPDPQLLSETYLVYAMNGSVLPLEHAYPARLLTPGRYGMKSPKWVIGIRPMTLDFVDWFGPARPAPARGSAPLLPAGWRSFQSER